MDAYCKRFYRILDSVQSQSSDPNLCKNYKDIGKDYDRNLSDLDKIDIGDTLNLIGRNILARSVEFRKKKSITPIISRVAGGGTEKIITKS